MESTTFNLSGNTDMSCATQWCSIGIRYSRLPQHHRTQSSIHRVRSSKAPVKPLHKLRMYVVCEFQPHEPRDLGGPHGGRRRAYVHTCTFPHSQTCAHAVHANRINLATLAKTRHWRAHAHHRWVRGPRLPKYRLDLLLMLFNLYSFLRILQSLGRYIDIRTPLHVGVFKPTAWQNFTWLFGI